MGVILFECLVAGSLGSVRFFFSLVFFLRFVVLFFCVGVFGYFVLYVGYGGVG